MLRISYVRMRGHSQAFNRHPLDRMFFKKYPFVVIGNFYDLEIKKTIGASVG